MANDESDLQFDLTLQIRSLRERFLPKWVYLRIFVSFMGVGTVH